MSDKKETLLAASPKRSYRSYFTLIRVFKKREKSSTEKNIIKIIHKSNICKSSPILKTLLIENVRVCCIVVESSGKQSVKILCASAPYIFALISKANPKLENFLRNEKLSSCLKILKESDFESVLNNVYHATVYIHSGVKKLYPTVCIGFIKDLFTHEEKSLLYLFKLMLQVLQSAVEFLYDNIVPLFHYLCRQNYAFAAYIADILPHLISACIKYSIITTIKAQNAVVISIQCMKKIILYLNYVLNHFYVDSFLNNWLKELYLFLKLSLKHLRSTSVYSDTEKLLLQLFQVSKPHLTKYFQKISEIVKNLILTNIPLVKDFIQNAFKGSIPLLQKCIDDNWESILNACNTTRSFLYENSHYIKPFCCRTCHFLYDSISYLYNIFQIILPHVIKFSSNAAISFVSSSAYVLECYVHLCKILCNHILPVIESQKRLACHLSQSALNILKTIYEIFLSVQPYIVTIFQITFKELVKLFRVLSPTLLVSLYEVNSSVFYASKELVAKSCLATKHLAPSFYYSAKAVLPPTVLAVLEVMKSSKNSVVIISPALLKCALTIRPQVGEGLTVVISDGNKAFLEIISVSYSVSYQFKDAAKAVSTNIPTVYKAIREILTTTAYAAVEISTTSLNAKSRMLKDFERAHEVVRTSFTLAEQEMIAVFLDIILEINSIIPSSQEIILSDSATINFRDFLAKLLFKSCNDCIKISQEFVNVLHGLAVDSMVYFPDISNLLVDIIYYLFFLSYNVCINISQPKGSKISALEEYLITLFWHTLKGGGKITASGMQNVRMLLCNNCSNINAKIIQNTCVIISKAWYALKCGIGVTWDKICLLTPQIWASVEHLASVFWNSIVENIPGVWMTWKTFCFVLWKLIYDLAPHAWRYSSTGISVTWTSGRELTKKSWNLLIATSSFTCQRTASLCSEYWLLSETYLPPIWFTSCVEIKKGWNITCCVIENCWNFSVETCFLSWNILHHTVARSWRNGLIFTKTAYCLLTNTGSMLQKSFCVYSKSKRYVCVMLQATPKIRDFTLKSFRTKKSHSHLPVQNFVRPDMDTSDDDSQQSSYLYNIKDSIYAVVNSLSNVDKLLSYEKIIPFKIFMKN